VVDCVAAFLGGVKADVALIRPPKAIETSFMVWCVGVD
jgi:hypothetical protein